MNLSHLKLCIAITAITRVGTCIVVITTTTTITQVTTNSLIIMLDALTAHKGNAE